MVWLYLVSALLLSLLPVGWIGPILQVRRARPRFQGWRRHGFVPPLRQDGPRVFAGDRVEVLLEMARRFRGSVRLDVQPGRAGVSPQPVLVDAADHLDVAFRAPGRGDIVITGLELQSRWPLGLLVARRLVRLDLHLVSHPQYVLPPREPGAGRLEGTREAALHGAGQDFIGLREYRPGDSQRRIHWPTSARTGSLMVIDTARESARPARYHLGLHPDSSPEAAELAVGVVASLMAGHVASGGGVELGLTGEPRLRRWSEILDALARAEPRGEPRAQAGTTVRIETVGVQVVADGPDGSRRVADSTPLKAAVAELTQP